MGCLPNPLQFTAGKLSSDTINSAQCPQTTELPADAKANQGECNQDARKTCPAYHVPAIE
jgi:hypothetical protein